MQKRPSMRSFLRPSAAWRRVGWRDVAPVSLPWIVSRLGRGTVPGKLEPADQGGSLPQDMPSTETMNHSRLKSLAFAWARTNGFDLCAVEVRVPRSGFRADVAACGQGAGARAAVFECKQSRADLLKDAHAEAATRSRLAALAERRRVLEELLAVHRPDLRRGEALWPEYDTWDFSTLRHRAYRGVLADMQTTQRRIVGGTKFSRMYRYCCADFLYLVVEEGIFAEAEIPAGWGLLVRRGDELCLSRPPAVLDVAAEQRAAILKMIVRAIQRAVDRAPGLIPPPPGPRPPPPSPRPPARHLPPPLRDAGFADSLPER